MQIFPGIGKMLPVLLFPCILLVTSCEKSAIKYGEQYIDNGISNIVLVDSISPAVSTIFKDSVISSQSGSILTGSYKDPYLGKITANSYLQLAPPTLTDMLSNAQYDSLVLLMKCNGMYYGDTTLPITLSVNQLSEELKLPETQAYFYNSSSFSVNTTPLGTRSFVLRPLTGDSANIRLDDNKGRELYNLIKTKADLVKNTSQFAAYFKGLNISSGINNNMYGFKDSVIMRLYYHQTDVGPQNKYFDFAFSNHALQFNHTASDRSGTPLTALNTLSNELPSTASGNTAYLQPLTGLLLKIRFPTIRKLLERTDFVKIIKADLVVKPLANSYNGLYTLPPVLYANHTDGSNEPGIALTAVRNGTALTESGNLFIDAVYGANTHYSYDVTSYLQQEINISAINKDGLLLLPPGGSRIAGLERLVIGDAANVKNKLQLNVYYISVKK